MSTPYSIANKFLDELDVETFGTNTLSRSNKFIDLTMRCPSISFCLLKYVGEKNQYIPENISFARDFIQLYRENKTDTYINKQMVKNFFSKLILCLKQNMLSI